MKHSYTLALCLLFLGVGAQAQITIEAKDVVNKYQEYYLAYGDDSTYTFDATKGTKDATWDFSNLVSKVENIDTMIFDIPERSEFKDSFPQANLMVLQDSLIYIFMKRDETGLQWEGLVFGEGDSAQIIPFKDPLQQLKVPMTNGSTFSDEGTFGFTTEFGEPPFTISITSEQVQTRSYTVDGYGSIDMPGDRSFDGLRLKVIEKDSSVTKISGQAPQIEVSYSYYYEFWAKEYGIAMVRLEVDSADHSKAVDVEFLDLDKTIVGISQSTKADAGLAIYPNPAADLINISHNGNAVSISLFDVSGREVISQSGALKTMDVSSLKPGVYNLRLLSDQDQMLDVERVLIR